jgi:membrane-associated protease RseP (regulator of RpoE activity)
MDDTMPKSATAPDNTQYNQLFITEEKEEQVCCGDEGDFADESTARSQADQTKVENKTCEDSKKRNDTVRNNTITKNEIFVIFTLIVLVVSVCSIMLQISISNMRNDYEEQIRQLTSQITILTTKIDTPQANADKPINITVNVDGVNKDFEYDPESGDVIEKDPTEQLPEEFDTRPFLGVVFDESDTTNITPLGLKVVGVYDVSPAKFAGIKQGDIITAIAGQKISTYADVEKVISQFQAEDTITVELISAVDSDIKYHTVEATLTYRGNFDLGE